MFLCNFCSSTFTQKVSLTRHLTDRCKIFPTLSAIDINEKIEQNKNNTKNPNKNTINNISGNNNTIIKIENLNVTIVNSVNKLDANYIEPKKMKELIEGYSYPKLNLLLGDYIKDLICNKEHPENHLVKYITKNPPRFNSVVEDKNGNKINVIKNLKDSCELLSKPVLDTLENKLKECLKKYKKDEDFTGDCEYEIDEINKELNKDAVKKALNSVLQNDILTDIQMKLTKEKVT